MYDPVERRNFYGRVHGKTLRQSQKVYLAEDLEALYQLLDAVVLRLGDPVLEDAP